ncbi:hypothetical protein A5764_09345 [Mycobacterium sp. 852002-51057_SCH5723018]|nr:hypothetical protein A5764_09345 [Mycobacterium sp. 852002-51057_SCH5723018]
MRRAASTRRISSKLRNPTLGDLDRVLLGVSLAGHAFVAVHWHGDGHVDAASQQYSLALGD